MKLTVFVRSTLRGLLAAFLLLFCAAPAGSQRGDEAYIEIAIQAFRASPEIAEAIDDALEGGYELGETKAVPYGSLCGAVGCGWSVLVLQRMHWRDTNPRTSNILGLVTFGADRRVSAVTHVSLVPVESVQD